MEIDIDRMYAKIKSEYGLITGVPVAEFTSPIKIRKFVFRGDLDENGDYIYRTFEEALSGGELENLRGQELEDLKNKCENSYQPFNYFFGHTIGHEFQFLSNWIALLPGSLGRPKGQIIVKPFSREIEPPSMNNPVHKIIDNMDGLGWALNHTLPRLDKLPLQEKVSLSDAVAKYGCLVCLGYDFGERDSFGEKSRLEKMFCSVKEDSLKIRNFEFG